MAYTLTATTPACNIPLQAINDSTYGNPQIESLRMTKESSLETIPRPSRDSNYTRAYDLLGVIRNIRISGSNQGTATQLKKFILDIEARIDGKQRLNTTPPKTTLLTLEMGGASLDIDVTYNIVIKNFYWNFNEGEPSKIDYGLEMIQSYVPV